MIDAELPLQDFETLLELPPGTLRLEDELGALTAWDSMAVLSFMAWADETRGQLITAEMVRTSKTVADLLRLL